MYRTIDHESDAPFASSPGFHCDNTQARVTREAIAARCHDIVNLYGARGFAFSYTSGFAFAAATVITNFDSVWFNCCPYDQLRRGDPVLSLAIRSTRPVLWSTVPSKKPGDKSFYEAAARAGIRDGLTTCIVGTDGTASILMLAVGSSSWHDEKSQALGRNVLWAATELHELATADSSSTNPLGQLTSKQLEALRLIAFGNSQCEAAAILNTTRRNVQDLLRRAILRLGARSLSTAVAIASSSALFWSQNSRATLFYIGANGKAPRRA